MKRHTRIRSCLHGLSVSTDTCWVEGGLRRQLFKMLYCETVRLELFAREMIEAICA